MLNDLLPSILPFSFFISIALLPSFVWLLFYLRKDADPEPDLMIVKIFFYGILISVPVYFTEVFLSREILPEFFVKGSLLFLILNYFIVIGFTEEIFKYVPFRIGALKSHALDEPVDIMLYMIIAGLGFAAAENTILLISEYPDFLRLALFSVLRFVSGTFFHALASGTFGYFIALSFWRINHRKKLFFLGLLIVTVLHGFYNLAIIEYTGYLQIGIPLAIILGLSIFLSFFAFPHLKKLKSVCLIKKK